MKGLIRIISAGVFTVLVWQSGSEYAIISLLMAVFSELVGIRENMDN
jgi:hypothetical protein